MTNQSYQGKMQSYRKDYSKTGLDKLTLVNEAIPKPERGEVLIKVKATSINYIDVAILNQDRQEGQSLSFIPLTDGAGGNR